MADLADRIDDLICTFDGTLNADIDTSAMYMFGVFVFVLFVVVFVFHIYGKNRDRTKKFSSDAEAAKNSVRNSSEVYKNAKTITAVVGTSKAVPSSPTIRRRFGSKSGNMSNIVTSTKDVSSLLPPSATGADVEAVKWVNAFFRWLFMDVVVVSELTQQWIQALNETMKPAVAEHGVGVKLIRILPETVPPSLNNLFCECASNDDVKITCDCEANLAMQLKALRQKSDKIETFHYRVNVNKLRSRLNITCVTSKLHLRAKFDGWPEIKVILAQVGSLRNNNLDEQSLQEVIVEIVSSALRNTDVSFNLSSYSNCPRFSRQSTLPPRTLPLHYDSLHSSCSPTLSKQGNQKLIVKVVKGSGLIQEARIPSEKFCVVEVDTPHQTNRTKSVCDTNSPFWNEELIFNINQYTEEILFEVYNRGTMNNFDENNFLGLAIISVQELIQSGTQSHVISLQSRPYEDNQVSGTLTLEFFFTDLPKLSDNATFTKSRKENTYLSTNLSPAPKTIYSKSDYRSTFEDAVTDANNKTTITHCNIQKPSHLPLLQSEDQENTRIMNKDPSLLSSLHKGDQIRNATQVVNRSSDRKRRNFFGAIRKQLKRSQDHIKSNFRNGYVSDTTDQGTISGNQPTVQISRAKSADRSLPEVPSQPLTMHSFSRKGSTRSSLSEMSGLSGASSRTYLNEASTLVLETEEDGIAKYFLVPLSLAQKNKWKKKGIKLHIFNEHTFVAKHLAGGTVCEVCSRTLPRRLGKQGYECRTCLLKCHKRCHVHTDITCPTASIPNLELAEVLQQTQ